MGYAVELYFDNQTEKSVWGLRHALSKVFPPRLASWETDLILVWRCFQTLIVNVISITKEYASKIEPFNFQLSAIGTFPTDENGLFLSPVPTNQLLNCHQGFHHRLAESEITPSAYYIPENWIPHCTVEMNIPNEQLLKAVEVCKKVFNPLMGQIREIGVVEFRPIKHLASWSLVK